MGRTSKIIHWVPRILSLGFVLFLSLFSLDTFSAFSNWQAILPFAIHLLPSLLLLTVALVSWKYDLVGTVLFLSFAALYILLAGFDRPWSWYAAISGPSALIGVLFLLSWIQKRKQVE